MAASTFAGRHVGRYLLRLGHRHIAFVSPFNNQVWSRNRQRGLLQACRDEKAGMTVDTFTRDGPARHEQSGVVKQIHEAVDGLFKSAMEKRGGPYLTLARTLRHVRWRLYSAVQEEMAQAELFELMEQAFAGEGATAWVGANDHVALECVHFLRQRGRRVPEDVSVVGLDDGIEAHLNKLTSYNFNGRAVIHAMVTHILDPTLARPGKNPSDPLEIEGFINVRGTTAKALLGTGAPQTPGQR